MTKHHDAKVTIVGAGPGDPDLITLAGVKALQSANVVLYDALANKALLQYAPDAHMIFVGKRKGFKAYTQQEINYLIVSNAFQFGHVVRLKGGDPFVFGRGHEELHYTQSFGLTVNVIPGISSSIAAPSTQGITLTQRGVAQSFWVLTGTTKNGDLSNDIALAAQSTATTIILMGMSKLNQITDIYQKVGRADLPVAIVQHATLPHQKECVGTMDTICSIVAQHEIANPAVIIIGEVVKYGSKTMQYFLQSVNTK